MGNAAADGITALFYGLFRAADVVGGVLLYTAPSAGAGSQSQCGGQNKQFFHNRFLCLMSSTKDTGGCPCAAIITDLVVRFGFWMVF